MGHRLSSGDLEVATGGGGFLDPGTFRNLYPLPARPKIEDYMARAVYAEDKELAEDRSFWGNPFNADRWSAMAAKNFPAEREQGARAREARDPAGDPANVYDLTSQPPDLHDALDPARPAPSDLYDGYGNVSPILAPTPEPSDAQTDGSTDNGFADVDPLPPPAPPPPEGIDV